MIFFFVVTIQYIAPSIETNSQQFNKDFQPPHVTAHVVQEETAELQQPEEEKEQPREHHSFPYEDFAWRLTLVEEGQASLHQDVTHIRRMMEHQAQFFNL